MGEVGDCQVICQRLPNNITGTKEFLVAAPSPHRKAKEQKLACGCEGDTPQNWKLTEFKRDNERQVMGNENNF